MTPPDADALGARALAHTLDLVRRLSVTGTEGEAAFGPYLAGLLRALPGFAAAGGEVFVEEVPGPPEGRRNVAALLPGRGRKAVVLFGHYDVVGVADYGPLAALAGEPYALREALIDRLRRTGEDPRALADLESGDWLPGRGLLDMKAGIGAGMAALEAFAARADREGSLVLVATPDEENQSAGMRAAGPFLARIARERGLDLSFAVNLDALQDDGDPALAQAVGLGCVGKHLVCALAIGREGHACYPFKGVGATFLASALVGAVECEPTLGEGTGAEASAPPVVLVQEDLRTAYDVTTPARAWCAWNVLTRRRTSRAALDAVADVARGALAEAVAARAERARRAGADVGLVVEEVPVLTYAEAAERAAARDPGFPAEIDALAAALAGRADLTVPTKARLLFERTAERAGIVGPAVVIGFGGLAYPPAPPLREQASPALEGRVRAAAARVAAARGVAIAIRDFLPVIVDMSFPGAVDRADVRAAARENPLWPRVVSWDPDGFPLLPIVNAGPWGRDYHRFVERAYAPYAFGTLPALVVALIEAGLEA